MSAAVGLGASAALPEGLSREEHAALLARLVSASGVPLLREWVVRWTDAGPCEDGALELTGGGGQVAASWLGGPAADRLREGHRRHALAGSHDELLLVFPEDAHLVLPGLDVRRARVELGERSLCLADAELCAAELRATREELAGDGAGELLALLDAGLAAFAFALEHAVPLSASWSCE